MSGAGKRALARDVFLYDNRNRATLLGGLVLNPGVTNANFYSLISIVLVFSSAYSIQDDGGDIIPQDSQPLLPGNYFVITDGTLDFTDEIVVTRTESLSTGTRVQEFRDEVRERDGGCVITKEKNPSAPYGIWRGYEAAHIFPLAYEQHWSDHNYARWITRHPSRGGPINSVQNGLLLRADIHTSFNSFDLAINPDDNYKIVGFQPHTVKVSGASLDQTLLDDPRGPAPELLRWHFRQAVLANMKGAGEPVFEHDFPSGTDIMADIRDGPKAAERMEFELFGRFAAHTQLDS